MPPSDVRAAILQAEKELDVAVKDFMRVSQEYSTRVWQARAKLRHLREVGVKTDKDLVKCPRCDGTGSGSNGVVSKSCGPCVGTGKVSPETAKKLLNERKRRP